MDAEQPIITTPFPVSFHFEQHVYSTHQKISLREEIADNLILVFEKIVDPIRHNHADFLLLEMIAAVLCEREAAYQENYDFGFEEEVVVRVTAYEHRVMTAYEQIMELRSEGKAIPEAI